MNSRVSSRVPANWRVAWTLVRGFQPGSSRFIRWVFDETTTNDEVAIADAYTKRWVPSVFKGDEAGKFELTAGKFYGDAEKSKGLKTSQDARFYGLSAKFDKFSNEGKPLVSLLSTIIVIPFFN